MKKFTFKALSILFCSLFAVGLLHAGEKLAANSITSKLNGYQLEQGKGVAMHVVQSDKAQRCDLSFLALPAGDTLGNFSTYTLMVNGIPLSSPITFTDPGWQQARTMGQSVLLNKGANEIIFTSNGRDLPQIRQIERYTGAQGFTSAAMSLVTNLQDSGSTTEQMTRIGGGPIPNWPDPPYARSPMYRPGVAMDQTYSYTFFLPLQYEAGDRASFYSPTPWDPRFGMYTSSVDFHLYFFHENPELFSESLTSVNKRISWSIDIEHPGTYYMLLEAKLPLPLSDTIPFATVFINNNMLYAHNLISSTSTRVRKQDPDGGVYVSAPDSCFNIFTVKPRSSNPSYEADPRLWLKKKVNDKEIIVAYSDTNRVVSDFDWGNNPRIRTKLEDDVVYNVLLSSDNPTGYVPDTCDLYHSFWNNPIGEGYYSVSGYPNLRYEDAIESDNSNRSLTGYGYNCFAWSGGINIMWAVPPENWVNKITWFDAYYNNEALPGEYGGIVRPPGSLVYTREGATEENAVVDLYEGVVQGVLRITHASVRNYACDSIPHGYDWESKVGIGSLRVFHPRYALGSEITDERGYGVVIAHYRIADDQEENYRSPQRVMAEAIADQTWRIENIYLTDEEETLLSDEAAHVSNAVKNEFNRLYAAWKQYTDARKYESNISRFSECDEYALLLSYATNTIGSTYLVYDRFTQGDFLAAVLIRDLALAPSSTTQSVWNNIMTAPIVNNTMRTAQANVTLYIKSVLQATETPEVTSVVRSNDDEFSVLTAPSQVTIEVEIENNAHYAVEAISLETNRSYPIVPARVATCGKHTHTATLPTGMYVVTYTLDGNLNCKKIVVP